MATSAQDLTALTALAHDAGLDLVQTDSPQYQNHTRLTRRSASRRHLDRPPSRILVANPECTRCRRKLPASEFCVRRTSNGQKRANVLWCRDCAAESFRQYRELLPDVDRLWPMVQKQGHTRRMLFRVLRAARYDGNPDAARQLLVMLGVGL